MTFTLIFKDISEERDIPKENYTIKDLLNDLELSSQTIVPKQNGELVIEESEIQNDDEIRLIQIIYGG
ncbi:MoaD/ThiS family protein [Methanobrevibacter smithii]|uniref:MoaD/ThiS family protein n=1 Tax=Methanobrevibacter smithii TaxID=2173 RepID=UPI0037DDD56A